MDTDRPATATETIKSFRTPTRILLPKLLVSRDGWKDKASERKRKLKAAQVRIRDLEASRQRWKEQAVECDNECKRLREQVQQLQQQVAEARQREEDAKKNSPACR